jgi:soluble lytic murein transglycosylase-like protein
MARIQYQPAGRSRGFKPRQISTAGISRMREESNRMIANMERNRQAEKEQRDRELQAIKENNAYTERVERQNFEIQTQNLQAERNEALQGLQVEQAQAQAQQAQTQSVLNVIGTLSKTASQVAEVVDAELLKRDTAEAVEAFNRTPVGLRSPEQAQRAEDYEAGRAAMAQGAVQYNTNTTEHGIRANETPAETARSIVSNHGLTGRSLQIYSNLIAYRAYTTRYQERTADAEYKYTAADGRQFTGAEAIRDPYFAGELQRLTLTDVVEDMGITEPMYLSQAQEKILQFNQSTIAQASNAAYEEAVEVGLDKASHLMKGGTMDDLYVAFSTVSHLKGNATALDLLSETIQDPTTPQEVVDNIGEMVINDKKFSEGWSKNRWLPALQKRQQNIVKAETADYEYRKEIFTNKVLNNIDEITAFIDENPNINGRAVEEQFTEQGFPVPPVITKHVSNSIKRSDEVTKTVIEQKFRDNILDEGFVNSLPTIALRRYAKELKEEQNNRKYGENYTGLKKNLIGDARQLTSINPGGANTSQTYLVYGRAVKEYQGFIEQGFTPVEAAGRVNELIQQARGGVADATNPFYFVSGDNNRRTFPNIESSGVQRAERRAVVDQKLLTQGIEVLNDPFVTATESEMDATYKSHLEGNTIYPPEILRVAEQFGIKPSEAYNTVRRAQNKSTGGNKPLLDPNNSVTKLMDVASPRARRLMQSGNTMQINRAAAGMGVIALPRRGGGSFNPAAIPSGYGQPISQAAQRNNIPPEILAGLIMTESAFNPRAVSPVGARGLGQFMPETAAEFGVNVNDPLSSIDGAARYLRYLIDYFEGDMNKAIYAYNGGMGNIERFGGPIPGNQENQEYLTKVLTNAKRFK